MKETFVAWLFGLAAGLVAVIGIAIVRDRALDRQEAAVERFLGTPIHFDGEDFYGSEALDALCQNGRCRWYKDQGRVVIVPEGRP